MFNQIANLFTLFFMRHVTCWCKVHLMTLQCDAARSPIHLQMQWSEYIRFGGCTFFLCLCALTYTVQKCHQVDSRFWTVPCWFEARAGHQDVSPYLGCRGTRKLKSDAKNAASNPNGRWCGMQDVDFTKAQSKDDFSFVGCSLNVQFWLHYSFKNCIFKKILLFVGFSLLYH